MIRKKKGSTLVTTIISFGVILTVGTAIVSMSMGDYKMRLSQNRRIMNLYGSDSGLDVAYDILVKDFDSAAQFGAFKAKQLEVDGVNTKSPYKTLYQTQQNKLEDLKYWNTTHTNPNEQKTPAQIEADRKVIFAEMDKLKNKEFRRSFKMFLYVPNSYNSNDEYMPNQLKSSIEVEGVKDSKLYTRDYFNGINKAQATLTQDITQDNIGKFFNTASVELVSNEEKSEPQITVDEKSVFPSIETSYAESDGTEFNKDYEIRINSTFITAQGNTNANGQDKRTVQAIYNLTVPNYDKVVFGESQIQEHSVYKDKGITIGGDMEVDNSPNSTLTINGNVYVQGSAQPTDLQSKYKGGITLNSVDKVNFNGNVVTGKTFNIGKDGGDASISENLYAGNVYAGDKDDLSSSGENCTLNVSKDMVLDNDLTLKATDSSITTYNFYGINDKRIESSDTKNSDDVNSLGSKVKNSSSIIVNNYTDNDKKPSIEIGNEALIMGVAYINTGSDQGYATGESVGVKRDTTANYSAYSEHVNSDNDNTDDNNTPNDSTDDNLSFDTNHSQNSPLYLVDGTVIDKNKHFYDYWYGKSGLLDGGVHFDKPGNIYSTGAIVYKDNGSKVVEAKGSMETLQSKVSVKQKEYASRVYDMDMNSDIDEITSDEYSASLTDSEKIKNEEYKNYLTNLYNNTAGRKKVDDLMDFSSSKFNNGAIKIGDINDEFGIFNPNSNRQIIIQDTSSSDTTIDGLNKDANDTAPITIYVPSGKPLNVFIATAGNVSINGNVSIKGNIIAKRDLTISGTGDKTITYDKYLASKLQMIDSDIFKQVFGSGDVSSEIKDGDKTEISVQYDLPKYLKNLLWTLVK